MPPEDPKPVDPRLPDEAAAHEEVRQADVDALIGEAEAGGEGYRTLLNLRARLGKLQLDFEAGLTKDLLEAPQEGRTLHLTVSVGPEEFAIPISQIRRLVRGAEVVGLPGAPRHLMGIINLRGDLIAVYDLPFLYGYHGVVGRGAANVVVLKGTGFDAGLSVTEIGRLVHLDEESLGPPPGTLPAPVRQIVRGTSYEGDRLLLFPDLPRLFTQLDARH
jgi:purine-binding chemotaxis protein CheW